MKKKLLPTETGDKRRLIFTFVFLSLLFCLLVIRFYQIQIIEGEKWTQIALSQHQTEKEIPFMRGSFFSNTTVKKGHPEEKQPLVFDVQKFHLFIDPKSIPERLKLSVANHLFSFLQLPKNKKEKFVKEFFRKSRSRKIAIWQDQQTKDKIEAWWKSFYRKEKIASNAIYFIPEYLRSYPFGSMLGAVLHTVQEQKDPKTLQSIPTGGLELSLNRYLQGKMGRKRWTRSPSRPLDAGEIIEEPENGADVYLTINHYLQAIMETELQKGVKIAGAKGGWAVMMDPFTGEILALAQTPSFHPAQYKKYFNDPKLQEYTRVKAVSDCYEPGSIFKPIILATCLKASEELTEKGKAPLFTPGEKVSTSQGRFPGRSRPLKDGRRHEFLNMDLAVQKSSNVYMGKVVQRLVEQFGDEWFRFALSEIFGFGQKTGVELPSESPGLLPTPGKVHPNGKLEWSLPTPYSLAMGHNILVNPIQMVKAFAILANGGFDVKPHLIRKIVKTSSNGEKQILVDNTSYRATKKLLSEKTTEALVHSMKFSTKLGGTSLKADVSGYTEAGKSGTSEKIINGAYSKKHNISSFLGFAPAKNPCFVLLISIDEPEIKWTPGIGKNQHGGVCAAPIFRQIAEKTLQYLGVEPDDPAGYPYGDPRRDLKKADWAFEVENLRELYKEWNGHP